MMKYTTAANKVDSTRLVFVLYLVTAMQLDCLTVAREVVNGQIQGSAEKTEEKAEKRKEEKINSALRSYRL